MMANKMEGIIEMLTRLVELHRVYMRHYVIGEDLLSDVLVFVQSGHLFLAVGRFRTLTHPFVHCYSWTRLSISASLEMFTKILSQENNEYNDYIRRINALEVMEECWQANGERKNALYSALYEFFGYIIRVCSLSRVCLLYAIP